ncbi:hypothetical protein RFI_20361 [Reticulomyxa filosa]|uniref:Protein-serine/threonine kinase n=1 Tax=Reticulomyxa filosa TaxID=46433 RepID=X6MSN9_RETFI|nr:hypothetical protein RFI_20361 [Reticulomyxa filosa]|eukprot:ETO16978.1 hypothetical protein RFI_20361 [Reticulomyxa filosa]
MWKQKSLNFIRLQCLSKRFLQRSARRQQYGWKRVDRVGLLRTNIAKRALVMKNCPGFHNQMLWYSTSVPHSMNAKPDNVIRNHAENKATQLTLKEIVEFSSPERFMEFASFIKRELPVRISHRVVELESLPYNLSDMPRFEWKCKCQSHEFSFVINKQNSILKLRNMYQLGFHLIRSLPEPIDNVSLATFVKGVESHFKTLANATEWLAAGITECTIHHPSQASQVRTCKFLNGFLDRFHASRIGTRLLTGQLCALYAQYYDSDGKPKAIKSGKSGALGIIDHNCSPKEVLQWAVDDASRMCHENFGKVPEVNIIDEQHIRFTYIPTHLHYILLELLKNSMRATCEHHKDLDESKLPPIEAIIVGSSASNEVTIKLCDQGGGIPKDNLDKIWLYSYSTVPPKDAKTKATPMAGLGYGLPLSRLHAQYFGGHLGVVSMHGYGTDAFLYLHFLISQ